MIATPPGSSPSKISALASAIASSVPKYSICAGAIAVTMATCGRTSRVSAASSPAWFMPISNTPKRLSRGIRARLSGTPTWLL
jgi:hypothetical protein